MDVTEPKWATTCFPSQLAGSSILVPKKLQDAMIENLDGECKQNSNDEFYKTVFEAIANAAALGFSVWLASLMVMRRPAFRNACSRMRVCSVS